jgi:hypothetical protein
MFCPRQQVGDTRQKPISVLQHGSFTLGSSNGEFLCRASPLTALLPLFLFIHTCECPLLISPWFQTSHSLTLCQAIRHVCSEPQVLVNQLEISGNCQLYMISITRRWKFPVSLVLPL